METFVTIEVYHSPHEADVVRQFLEQAGIKAFLLDDHAVATYSVLGGAIGGVKLQVSSGDQQRALELLQEVRALRNDSQDAEPVVFRCSQCHGRLEYPGHRRGGVETCQHCGEYVDVPELGEDSEPPESVTSMSEVVPENAMEESKSNQRRIPLHLEIVGVLSFVYLPLLFNAFLTGETHSYSYVDFMSLFVDSFRTTLPLIVVLLLLGEGLEKFGWKRIRPIRDTVLAVGFCVILAVVSQVAALIVTAGTQATGTDLYSESGPFEDYQPLLDPGWSAIAWCVIALAANSVAEELCMRGYLITRLNELWGSRIWAVAISSILFGSYHVYQGYYLPPPG